MEEMTNKIIYFTISTYFNQPTKPFKRTLNIISYSSIKTYTLITIIKLNIIISHQILTKEYEKTKRITTNPL